jgi:hypothetical protein
MAIGAVPLGLIEVSVVKRGEDDALPDATYARLGLQAATARRLDAQEVGLLNPQTLSV